MRSGWDRCSERCKVAICGIKCIDLTKETIKILVVFFSYDKNLQLENNFRKTILNIKKILKMWRQMNLTLEGKMIVFKTLTLSKITFLAHVLLIPNQIIDGLQQIQKIFHGTRLLRKWNMKPFAKIFNMKG